MTRISEAEFLKLKEENLIFPMVKEINADELTPISIFNSISGKNKCLLESSYGYGSSGRFSFICMDPYLQLKSYGNTTVLLGQYGEEVFNEDSVTVMRRHVKQEYYSAGLKIPFLGGAVGYVGYDVARNYERLQENNPSEIQVPESYLLFYRKIICYDHMKHTLCLIYNVHPQDNLNYITVLDYLEALSHEIKSNNVSCPLPEITESQTTHSNLTKDEYCSLVEKAKEYIMAGDIFQVVISQRFKVKQRSSAFEVYRRLRSKNPSPYLFYIDFEDFQIVGSSPESLVSVKGDTVTTNPIAGTRPRGKTEEEDLKLKAELLADEKERAEHVMLVDLGRNDIGKVSRFGTVTLDRFMEVDYYSHVMHIVTTVSGKLKEKIDCFDALKACAPAGTVSGAPKIRAMEIIDELEKVRRGIYAGAVGYFSHDGNMDVCIAIRTIVFKDEIGYVQAGAGVVSDSNPETEYFESCNKAKALIEVI